MIIPLKNFKISFLLFIFLMFPFVIYSATKMNESAIKINENEQERERELKLVNDLYHQIERDKTLNISSLLTEFYQDHPILFIELSKGTPYARSTGIYTLLDKAIHVKNKNAVIGLLQIYFDRSFPFEKFQFFYDNILNKIEKYAEEEDVPEIKQIIPLE